MGIEFHQWTSMAAVRKRIGLSKHGETIKDNYLQLIKFFEERSDVMSLMTCEAELDWYKYGTPYYKIWPNMADSLANISIEIAGRYLHMPFPTFAVYLPKTPGMVVRENDDSPVLEALLVHKQEPLDLSFLKEKDRDFSLMVHYQFEGDRDKDFMGFYYRFGIKNDDTLEAAFEKFLPQSTYDQNNGYVPGDKFVKRIVKLAIATSFFGVHNHSMVMPEIPNKYVERWYKAKREKNESEQKKLLDKAKRLGMFGFRIGSEIDLPQPHFINKYEDARPKGGGKELNFGHVRSAHMRLTPYGPREKPTHYELIFIPPTVVRPDLPIRDVRGFRLKDDKLPGVK